MRKGELASFLKQISFYLERGIGIREAIKDSEQEVSKRSLKMITLAISYVDMGKSFSLSLKNAQIINEYQFFFLSVGEQIGELKVFINKLIEQVEYREEMNKKIISGMIYPSVIILAGFCLFIFLCVFIFPKINRIFLSLKISLPFITKSILYFSNIVREHILIIIFLVVLMAVILFILIQVKALKRYSNRYLNYFLMNMPIISKLYELYWNADIYSVFYELFSRQINIDSIKEISRMILPFYLSREYSSLLDKIKSGASFSSTLMEYKRFPKKYRLIIKASEKTGNLSSVFEDISNDSREEFRRQLGILVSFLEPTLMLFIGIMVMITALSIILPIYKITGSVGMK